MFKVCGGDDERRSGAPDEALLNQHFQRIALKTGVDVVALRSEYDRVAPTCQTQSQDRDVHQGGLEGGSAIHCGQA